MLSVRTLFFVFLSSNLLAGLLPSNQPYTFTGGFVTGEAENYHAKSPSAADQGWREIPTQAVVPAGVTFDNPSGGLAMQVPNVNGTNAVNYADGPFIDYYINIPGPGTYQLFLTWDGYDTASDSIYAGFTGGSGITPSTWYQDGGHVTSNFPQQGWDGTGEVGANNGSPAQNPMNFTFLSSGIYTLRIVAREDGVALDRFRIQLATLPDPNPVAALGQNILIGSDDFTYANGSIAGRNGGVNWDFDNQDGDGFVGLRREGLSNWDTVFGSATIAANKLTTADSAAKREFGFPNEGDGAVSETGGIRYKQVYYRVKMTRAAGATWGGVSMYDFNNERIFFGVDFNPPVVAGPRHFAIGQGGVTYTSKPAVDATDYIIVAKIDYENDKLSLWVDPDLTQPEGTPDATRPWQSDNWNTAVRLGSGGTGATTWDDLAVGTSWGAIQAAYPVSTPVTGADVIIAREDFDYDNGNVVGQSSGFGWDFDNSTTNNAFIGRTQTPSNWDNVEGLPYIFSKRLSTWNSSAKREYNVNEVNGVISNVATSEYKVVYYRFEMQRSADNVSWSGLSLYDGNNERLMFGVPFAQNPANNRRELGIHNLGANQWNYTGIEPVAGTKYQIIAKVDYTTGFASLYVNPSLTGGEPGSPNATLAFTNAHSALRFGSGGDSPTYWDKLIVGTSWNAVVTPTYPAPAALSGADLVIGTDTFTYSGGPIALQQGGTGWDFQNTFGPVDSNDPSAWSHQYNSPYIFNNTLRTWNAGALRTFNGVEADGAINDADTSAAKAVYVRVDMRRDAGVSWGGLSLYDFGTERFLFGVPFAENPASNVREFAIHDLATGHTYSGTAPVAGTDYTIVAKLDFVANKAVLWVNPDLSQPESANTIAAERAYTGTNWITGVRLASSADGDTHWDNLAVTTSWRALQSALGPPTAVPDAITMRHNKKALLDVRQNDAGVGSVVIVTPPSSGTASVDSSGRIFYEHTTGTPASDSLTYKLVGTNGESAPTTVTYTFTSALRLANTTSIVPLTPPATGLAVVDSTPGLNFTAPSCMTHVPGSTNKVLVGERNGKIWLIDDIHAIAPTKTLFMTLPVYDDGNELGLKGLALHPQFATNRQFFVTYNLRDSNADFARVSRFTTVGNTDVGDLASEQPFISIPNPSSIHNIDSCRFGPDGYFYWAAGDAGGLNDGNNNAQRIDKDFWGGIFRIDVDRLPANLEPNAHSGIVMNGANAFFKVPADNPFIGATSFNGVALTGTLRTEIYAIGFRNPWQFSWDTQNGEMWAADVGLDSWEEVDVITPGGNFGWSYLEGTANCTRTNPPVGFSPIAPLWTYFHGGGALEGRSVTGGFVYRGSKYPALAGKYIFGDFVSGHIWSLTRNGVNPPTVERITGEAGVVAFMLDPDPANGDILMLDYGDGKVRRLVSQTVDTTFPAKLSDTGLFADISDLSFNPGIERYDINLPFWSDYAIKSRWFMLPNGSDTFGFVQDGNWSLPQGALFIKHFDYELTRGNPATKKRLETRLLMINATGSYGVSYRWNETGTEAFLVADGGEDFDMNVVISGTPTNVHWRIPSRSECLACHTPQGGHGLSFETRQLNRTGTLGGQTGNYLELMANAGYFSNAPTQFHTLPKYHTPTDTSATLETRARSWLAVNCSYCHQTGGTGIGAFDMRPELSLTQTTMIDAHVGNVQAGDHKALVRGFNDKSVIWNRLSASGGYTRMPPLATAVIDPEGTQVVMDWINSMASRQTYAEWRFAQFGSSSSPAGDPAFDADGDGVSNMNEFLGQTLPLSGNSTLQPLFNTGSTNLSIQFPNLLGRRTWVETSTNLTNWTLWDIPGNNGTPSASGSIRTLTAPIDGPMRYFRLKVEEQ
ncbi:MAG: PQQ-dependent sugar dehydrogenase [Verrucomicrobiaceae bacterium]|nr:PQQ-dependent sugar dehydrogenase [Verrucomicrobiaceae bacterium]